MFPGLSLRKMATRWNPKPGRKEARLAQASHGASESRSRFSHRNGMENAEGRIFPESCKTAFTRGQRTRNP